MNPTKKEIQSRREQIRARLQNIQAIYSLLSVGRSVMTAREIKRLEKRLEGEIIEYWLEKATAAAGV